MFTLFIIVSYFLSAVCVQLLQCSIVTIFGCFAASSALATCTLTTLCAYLLRVTEKLFIMCLGVYECNNTYNEFGKPKSQIPPVSLRWSADSCLISCSIATLYSLDATP